MNLSLARWDPFRTRSLEFGVPSLFEDFLRLPSLFGWWDRYDTLRGSSWFPPVDIRQEPERILVTAELPGFKGDQVSIQMEENVLTISGERKREKEDSDRNSTRVERSYGQFVRSFTLPSTVDRENIHATFEDGVLTIELPRTKEGRPRQIPITRGKG